MQSVRRPAFTLVELLVVIGIIALLIGVLMPALAAARRQSQTVKCLASLKEIGNAFQMYAIDSKGYYPPAQLILEITPPAPPYSLYGADFGSPATKYGAYWFNFLNKYVSKEKIGEEDTGGQTIDNVRTKSLFWGCPAFDTPYTDISTGGTNRVQPGYGMNGYPSFDFNYPGSTTTINPVTGLPTTSSRDFPPASEWAWNVSNTDGNFLWQPGTRAKYGFVKQKTWTKRGAERMLVGDSRLWVGYAGKVTTQTVPDQLGEVNDTYDAKETYTSLWRHGKMPTGYQSGNRMLYPIKGKIAFNILYCDGHVATSSDPKEAYKSIRMKFPG